MRIRRLKLTGFKSFVDPAELVIQPGLTGIVGPNGCGKSNLLEAIRWVMGEGSPKSLRGAGMEDVIFAGTAHRPARDFAEVAMLLERLGEDAAGLETEVVRRIERGVGSAYRIDGRDVRQKDVALLFADAATGAHSPALVSQGRIGAIIAARPAERRAMLEEAAGIAGLDLRRRDAEQKLRATEINLERLDTVLGDMATRALALRRQARSAERYRTLSTEIRLAEGRLIYARWREASVAAETAKHEAAVADANVAGAVEAQRRASEAAAAAARTLATARSAALSARDVAAGATYRLEALTAEQTAIGHRLAELERLRGALARDRAREGALAADAAATIARLEEEGATLEAHLAEAVATRPTLVARLGETEQGLRDAEVALAQALAADAIEQAEARIAHAALIAARGRLDRADDEIARLGRERTAVGDAAALAVAMAGAGEARKTAVADVSRLADVIVAAEAERGEAAAAWDTAQAEAAAARAHLASLQAEVTALHHSLPATTSDMRAIDRMHAAPGYERALAAALGDDLEAPIANTGSARWSEAGMESEAAPDPALPAGCERLADHVEAPAALAPRLVQIGVIEADDGSLELAVGQRLVTRDGRLRRWDGFIAEDHGAATAGALIRRSRRIAIEAQLPAARISFEAAERATQIAAATLRRVRAEEQAARTDLAQAEARLREATLAEDRAHLAIERIAARHAELADRATALAADREAVVDEVTNAAASVAALPDAARTSQALADRRAAAEAARARVAQLRADLAALDRDVGADRARRAAAVAEAEGWRARSGDAERRIVEMAARARAAEEDHAVLAAAPVMLKARIAAAGAERTAAIAMVTDTATTEARDEAILRAAEAALSTAGEAVAMMRERRATALARHEHHEARRIEMGRASGERFQCPAPLLPHTAGFPADGVIEVEHELRRLETLTLDRERIGPVNLVAEQELAALDTERATQAAEREELGHAVARLRGSIGSLNREGRNRLLAAFEAVAEHFRRLFARLFAGGEAHLALVDSDDPLQAGLEIMAQPPGKKLTSLTLLSGGEQALTAIALIFAIFLTNPAPICVLDEVDAPLDDANIERFCDLLDQMVLETDTRYLVVTHNAVSMARMHRLFGVTMAERGVSRLVSVDLGGAETLLAAK